MGNLHVITFKKKAAKGEKKTLIFSHLEMRAIYNFPIAAYLSITANGPNEKKNNILYTYILNIKPISPSGSLTKKKKKVTLIARKHIRTMMPIYKNG